MFLTEQDQFQTVDQAENGDGIGVGAAENAVFSGGVLGVGEAIIDFSAQVQEEGILSRLRVDKGGRRVIDMKERTELLQSFEDGSYRVCAGGSVSNTLVGISQLARAAAKNISKFSTPYNVAMAGRVGDDLLGQYFKNSMTQNGVEFLSPSQPGTSTGTVIVLTTPDAQRTFLAFQGDSNFEVPADHLEIFTKAKIIVIEGYLLEHQNSLEKILKIINFAKQAGVLTAVSAGDPGLVKRCRTAFNKIIESGVDIFLSNQAEAVTFLELPQSTDAQDAAMLLGKRCPIAVVTDGSKGSHIYEQQQDKCYSMKPYWTSEPPVDTTGAGDAYAAGLLFGMIMGLQFQNCGELGSRMASAVIGQIGCRVRQEEADEVYNQFVNDVQEVRELIQSPI